MEAFRQKRIDFPFFDARFPERIQKIFARRCGVFDQEKHGESGLKRPRQFAEQSF
jgi:hypothetical protein